LGARYETGKERMTVVSMGTGTSIVKCDGDDIQHIGGIGIGGGTLMGLSRILLKTDDIKTISELAKMEIYGKNKMCLSEISVLTHCQDCP